MSRTDLTLVLCKVRSTACLEVQRLTDAPRYPVDESCEVVTVTPEIILGLLDLIAERPIVFCGALPRACEVFSHPEPIGGCWPVP